MALIDLQNISKQYDTKVILKDANFTLNHGQRIAVIGQNGQGKSTLFKIIMKQTEPDSGEMAIDKSLKIEMLDQQPKFKDNLNVRDAIENQLAELKSAKNEYEKMSKAHNPYGDGKACNRILDFINEMGMCELNEIVKNTGMSNVEIYKGLEAFIRYNDITKIDPKALESYFQYLQKN